MLAARTSVPIYPQTAIEDSSLPELSRLFNGEWVWKEYCSRFGERELSPERIRIRQLSHNPGRIAIVSYVAEWHPDEFIPAEQFAVEVRRSGLSNLYRYPDDPHLPGLNEAASVESALKLVNRHVLSIPSRRLRVDMVRYRPGNRAVLRHRIGKVRFYARVMRPAALESFLSAAHLVQHSGFVVPRIAGCWQDGGVIWLSEIPGKNMRRYIRRGNNPPPDALLDGLSGLWSVPMRSKNGRPFNLAGAYRRAKRAFTNAVDDGDAAQHILAEAVNSLEPFVKSWRPSHLAQNDFYDDQMLVLPDGRISLVDFEEAGPGDPMLDVGNFLAHLSWGAHFRRKKEAEAQGAYRYIFRRAALERFRWDERELALREAVCLFRICTNVIRHPQADWRRRLEDGLSLVNETVG